MTTLTLWELVDSYRKIHNVQDVSRRRLNDLLDAADCPSRFLPGLATVVGFSDDLLYSQHLDGEEWRPAVQLGHEVFRDTGGHEVIRDVCRSWIGARVAIADWHGRVAIAGSGFPWHGTGAPAVAGDWHTDLHIETLGVALDTDLITDALDAVRAAGESMHVILAELVENWGNLFRWVEAGDGTATVSGQVLTLDATALAAATVTLDAAVTDTSLWASMVYLGIVRIPAASAVAFAFHVAGANDYDVTLTAGAGPAGTVVLRRNGVAVATVTPGVPADPAELLLEVRTTLLITGSLVIEVLLQGASLITYTDGAPNAPGEVRWSVGANDAADVLFFEAMHQNPTTLTVGA